MLLTIEICFLLATLIWTVLDDFGPDGRCYYLVRKWMEKAR